VKSIVQGLIVFSQGNKDDYPFPSQLDKNNKTVNADSKRQEEKDNTGNILSVLCYNNFATPDILVSPAEKDTNIKVDKQFERAKPSHAVSPDDAVWDPGMSGFPGETTGYTGLGTGGRRDAGAFGCTSYGHTTPFGKKAKMWQNSAKANEAVVANRGPMYGGTPSNWTLTPDQYGTGSITLRIYGAPTKWEGNVGYNDGSVAYELTGSPKRLTLAFEVPLPDGTMTASDHIFVNEKPESSSSINADVEPTLGGANVLLRSYGNVTVNGSSVTISVFRD
jgi:hypothetical protein